MFKKIKALSVLLLVAVMLASFCMPASAAAWQILQPGDYIDQVYYEGNIRNVTYDFKTVPLIKWRGGSSSGSFYSSSSLEWDHYEEFPLTFQISPLGKYNTGGPPLSNASSGQIAIDVSDYKKDAIFNFHAAFDIDLGMTYDSADGQQATENYTISVTWSYAKYDSNGTYRGSSLSYSQTYEAALQDTPDRFTYNVEIDQYATFDKPDDGILYIVPNITATVVQKNYTGALDIRTIDFRFDRFTITTRTDMLVKESETLDRIEEEISETNDKLDQTNDKLDQIIDQPEQEKQEATDEGGEMVDQLTGAMPDESGGFIDGLSELASAMSYEGTDAQLTFPAISLPAIPGVMKSYKLNDEMPIDFSYWVQKIPAPLLTLVQVVLTLALVVFAFKELYNLIAYAMTLKGGSSDG